MVNYLNSLGESGYVNLVTNTALKNALGFPLYKFLGAALIYFYKVFNYKKKIQRKVHVCVIENSRSFAVSVLSCVESTR